MAFWVYILRCADASYYTGHTDNLEKRIGEHTVGAIASCYTFKRRPLELVFSQDFTTREEALASEQRIKGWSRKKKEAMMRGDWTEVSRLARSAHPESFAPVRTEPLSAVRPDPLSTVRPEPLSTVRPEPLSAVRPDPLSTVRPEPLSTVRPDPLSTVRPEPVEGQEPSIHPSTSSGRTEGKVPL